MKTTARLMLLIGALVFIGCATEAEVTGSPGSADPPACPRDQNPCETDTDCAADPEMCVKGCCVPSK